MKKKRIHRRKRKIHAAGTAAAADGAELIQDAQNRLPEQYQRVRVLQSLIIQRENIERQLKEHLIQLTEQLQGQQTPTLAPDVGTESHNGQNDFVATEPEIEKRQLLWRSFPTCCRCHQLTSDLKLFPCIHGCCSACLDQLRQASTTRATAETKVINCPECGQRATDVLSDSPANRYVVKLTKSIASRDDGLAMSRCSWGGHETTDGDHVTHYCYECGKELCSGCVVEHSRMRSATSHFVVPIEDMLPLEGDTSCKDHGGQQVSIYCVSCKKSGCVQCYGSHSQHRHQIEFMTDLAGDCQQGIIRHVGELRSEIDSCENRLCELNNYENLLKDNVDQLKSDIQNQYRDLLEWINSIRDSLHKKVETFEEQSACHLKFIELATKRQLEVTRAIEQFCLKVLKIGEHCQIELACFHMNLSEEALTWPTEVLQMALPKRISFHPVDLRSLLPDNERCLIGEVLDDDQQAERFITWTEIKTQLEKMSQEHQQLEKMKSELEQKLAESNKKFENQVKEKDELISAQEESIDVLEERKQKDEQKLTGLIREKTKAQNRITELEGEIAALQKMNEDLESQKTSVENNLTTKQTELKELSQLAQNDKEELSELQSAVQQAASREKHLESRMEQMESVSCRLQSDIEQAVDRERRLKAHLDQLLTEQAPPKLVPVGRIPDTEVRGLAPVFGVATLNGKLCVLRMGSSKLEIYDSDTFLLLSELLIHGLLDAIDMTSCVPNSCIYVADGRSNKVHSIVATACNTDVGRYVRTKWIITVDGPRGLSVTPIECHLLVTCATEPNQLMIFNADSQLLKTIPVDVGGSIRHGVLLPSGQLLVCFCAGPGDIGGIYHVTQDGFVKQKLSGGTPYHLAVDSFHNEVYVANFEGRRVMLLHRDLADMSEPTKNEDGEYNEAELINQPLRLCLDKDNKRLYVAECGGRISVYAVNETRTTIDVPSQR